MHQRIEWLFTPHSSKQGNVGLRKLKCFKATACWHFICFLWDHGVSTIWWQQIKRGGLIIEPALCAKMDSPHGWINSPTNLEKHQNTSSCLAEKFVSSQICRLNYKCKYSTKLQILDEIPRTRYARLRTTGSNSISSHFFLLIVWCRAHVAHSGIDETTLILSVEKAGWSPRRNCELTCCHWMLWTIRCRKIPVMHSWLWRILQTSPWHNNSTKKRCLPAISPLLDVVVVCLHFTSWKRGWLRWSEP